jgi:TnpA family transposase
MKGDYPRFNDIYSREGLIEHFLLSKSERLLTSEMRSDVNKLGFATLLKTVLYLGYFPKSLRDVPSAVREFIAEQLQVPSSIDEYAWSGGTRDDHIAAIRIHTGFQFITAEGKEQLENWLRDDATDGAYEYPDLFEAAIKHLMTLRIELPSEKELHRIVAAALNGYLQKTYWRVSDRLSMSTCAELEKLIQVSEGAIYSTLDQLKRQPADAGLQNLAKEIAKLKILKSIALPESLFAGIPEKIIDRFDRQTKNERPSELREHPDHIKFTLLSSFVYMRTGEVIDDIIRMFMNMIHRMNVESEQELDKRLLSDMKKVEGKVQMLFRIANAVVQNPDGKIREVIFSEVKEETFRELVAEYEATGARFSTLQQRLMRQKYVYHYQRMLPLILENLTFRSGNQYQPVIKALDIIARYLGSDLKYFPEEVPIDGVVSAKWQKSVVEIVDGEIKVSRKMYEMCVLIKALKALKCREVWVEGAKAFRNPDQDMPPEWHDKDKRKAAYARIQQPLESSVFVEKERNRMMESLAKFNQTLPGNSSVKIVGRRQNEGRGRFSLSKLEAQEEPENLAKIKQSIKDKYGMIELLDVLVEAERLTGFTRFFRHSGTKEVRSRDALRPLLLLDLFAEATNTGIARVAKANEEYSYEELHYVRRNYIWREPLRNANTVVVNRIFQIRDLGLWGHGNACASDGKSFPAWNRNLLSEWRTRYKGDGVMAYWHVEKGSSCIYSQLKNYSPSETGVMLDGLIRHDTEMRVDKNFVDSHGQSEVAFALCKLLGLFRLVPRLKNIKKERLYLPAKGMSGAFPNLAGVLTRPIRWDIIEQQYDEMVKVTTAMRDGHASADAILRRFNSHNLQHPTYKALLEPGKAEKTIFLCEWLPDLLARKETDEGLNIVESFNAATDFVSYGSHGILATNDREDQEIKILSLQLLQNCMMLINTILVQRILKENPFLSRLTAADLRGLTPLFYGHINPYGLFYLDLNQPSFLEAA